MTFAVDRLMRRWDEPPPDRVAAEAAFHRMYADPVSVNGAPLTVSELVDMALSLSAIYEGAQREILDVVEGDGRVAVAFRLRGRQVGPLSTPLGTVAPTGRIVEMRVIDILTISDGVISSVWVVFDDLGLLRQLEAVVLVQPGQR
jgi:predicted ester cyclase